MNAHHQKMNSQRASQMRGVNQESKPVKSIQQPMLQPSTIEAMQAKIMMNQTVDNNRRSKTTIRGAEKRDNPINTQANSMVAIQKPDRSLTKDKSKGKNVVIKNKSTYDQLPIQTTNFDATQVPRKFQLPQLNLQLNSTNRFEITGILNQSTQAIANNGNFPKYVAAQSVKATNPITTPGSNAKVVASHSIQAPAGGQGRIVNKSSNSNY